MDKKEWYKLIPNRYALVHGDIVFREFKTREEAEAGKRILPPSIAKQVKVITVVKEKYLPK